MFVTYDILISQVGQVGVTLALAALIGLEREQKQQKTKHFHFGGVRTFILIGIFGLLTGYLGQLTTALYVINSIVLIVLIATSYFFHAQKTQKYGITTELAGVLTFTIGILISSNAMFPAVLVALVTATVMHFKSSLHEWAGKVSNKELIAVLQFILIAFVILPLLPDQAFGPYDFFNPRQAWFMVVLIATLSAVSYIAIKVVGSKRGIAVTGFLAGFVSSTALTLTFAEQSKRNPKIVKPYAIAICIASSAMFFRVLVEISIVNAELLQSAVFPLAAMGITGIAISVFLFAKKSTSEANTKKVEEKATSLASPLEFSSAVKFALYFVGILFITKAASELLGEQGIYISSILSGVIDVDAITVSLSQLAKDGKVTEHVAITGITLAAATNTIMKATFFAVLGSRPVSKYILPTFAAIVATGLVTSVFV